MKPVNKLAHALWLLPLLVAVPAFLASAALTGQQVYDQYCASCHKLGTYDTSGSPDLQGSGSKVSGKYTAGVSGHKGITLAASDISNVSAFLNSPTSSASLSITTASLPNGAVGTAYSQALTASGGTPPYTWSYNGTLPAGIVVTSAGAVTGTPTAAGTFSFTARVADSKSAAVTKTLSLNIAAAAAAPMTASDKNLFLANCVSCHTPAGLQNRTASQIKAAISGNAGGMGTSQLKALTTANLEGIARSLVPKNPAVPSCASCHSGSSPSPSPPPATGQAVYDASCAGCHKLGSYDISGSAPDLSAGGSKVDGKYTADKSGHKGVTLTSTQISNLKTFLNAH
jgi:mono/diheme cytochrome c family protein